MALNRDIVAEVINKGDAALYGPFPWALAGYTKRADYSYTNLGPNYQYNPKEAKRLLAAAGYPNGFEVELEWAEFQGWTFSEFAQLSARFFSDIGVRVKLKQLETSTWLSKMTGVQPFNQMLATFSPIGAGELHGLGLPALSRSFPRPSTASPSGPQARRSADLVADRSRRQARPSSRPSGTTCQNVCRITTIVPPHCQVTQSYVHAG
jgi:ABC-type transport system substrate-binding protein